MISLKDLNNQSGVINCTVERGCENKGQCYCSGKCHEIVGQIVNGKFEPNLNISNGLKPTTATNAWGASIKDCDEFFDMITKNAGPRDI